MSLHGAGSFAAQQELYSQWNEIAGRENFIAVYPQGALESGFGWRWNAGEPLAAGRPFLQRLLNIQPETIDDEGFLTGLLAHLSGTLCIDPARVFVNGISNGGGMTYHMACVLSDKIAAIGTVAGAYTAIPDRCDTTRPMPVVTFQGKDDGIVPYDGHIALGMQGVESWAADWATRNECDPTPEPIGGTAGAVTGMRYVNCAEDAGVDLYTIADGGHTWPGAEPVIEFILGFTNQDIDATETMWAFFAAHPMK